MRYQALNQAKMYQHILSSGKRVTVDGLSLCFVSALSEKTKNSVNSHLKTNTIRVGFLIRKKTGKAYFRNRLRRILRHSCWTFKHKNVKSLYLLFDVPAKPLSLSLKQFRHQIQDLLLQMQQKLQSC